MGIVPPDLVAACIQWLRFQGTIVLAFGDSATTPKFFSTSRPAAHSRPGSGFSEPEGEETYDTKDDSGLASSLEEGDLICAVTGGGGASGKVALRQLADQVASILADAPLTFADGSLVYLRRARRRYPHLRRARARAARSSSTAASSTSATRSSAGPPPAPDAHRRLPLMPGNQKMSGKASYLVYDGANVPITKVSMKGTSKMADATDNSNYDQTTDLIWPEQLKVNAKTELAVEGRYFRSVTPALAAAFFESNPGGLPVVLGLDTVTVAGHGYFDMSDFQIDDEVEDTVTYSCTLTSNGQFYPNS